MKGKLIAGDTSHSVELLDENSEKINIGITKISFELTPDSFNVINVEIVMEEMDIDGEICLSEKTISEINKLGYKVIKND